jgi:hypothetical protein
VAYKSEIFIPSIGMLIVSWHENPAGKFVIDDIQDYTGFGRSCLFQIAGFQVLLMQAIVKKTQAIKAVRKCDYTDIAE